MKVPFAVLILIGGLAFASLASADSGINFSWDACSAEGGIQSKNFSCNTNTSTKSMYGSFILPADQDNFVGVEATIDVQAEADSLPSWWQFYNPGACRSSSISVNFLFDSDPNTSCTDPWSGAATGGIAAFHTYWSTPPGSGISPNSARIKLGAALPSTSPIQLTAGTEYYCFKLVMTAAKTVGSGACGGCSVPACLSLYSITAAQADGSRITLTAPLNDNLVRWQSPSGSCSGAQIAPPPTWGQMRSLLR